MEAIIGLGADGAKADSRRKQRRGAEIGLGRKLEGFANRRRTEVHAWKSLEMAHWRRGTVMLLQRGSQGLGMYEGRNE